MGYETKLIIGRALNLGKENYMCEIAAIDLCKVAYDKFGELISMATGKESKYPLISFSEPCVVDEDRVLKEIEKRGIDADVAQSVIKICEDHEKDITEDFYGSKLRAVPIADVIAAMKETMAADKENGEKPYRRFVIALPMLKSIKRFFPDAICILFGH